MDLLRAPFNYSCRPVWPSPNGATVEVGDDDSAEALTVYLEGKGWTVVQTSIWNRYTFTVPGGYDSIDLHDIDLVEAINDSNHYTDGMSKDSIRPAGCLEEGDKGSSNLPPRLRVSVDISPEGETYLRSKDMLLRTVASGSG